MKAASLAIKWLLLGAAVGAVRYFGGFEWTVLLLLLFIFEEVRELKHFIAHPETVPPRWAWAQINLGFKEFRDERIAPPAEKP